MDINFRLGTQTDVPVIVNLALEAGNGLFEFLLDDLVPGVSAFQFLCMAANSEDSPLNFANALLAEKEGRILGMALAYSSADYGLPAVLQNLLPRKRLAPVAPLFASKVANSWYLNTLVVGKETRGKGLGRLLVNFSAELGAEAQFDSITLHAWADNDDGLAFYRSLGFQEIERLALGPLGSRRPHGEMLLMKAPLPLGR